MPRIVKGKKIIMTKSEYESIQLIDGDYVLLLPKSRDLITDEIADKIFVDLRSGKSRPQIVSNYAEYGLNEYSFNELCRKRFGTIKITEIRDRLKEQFYKTIEAAKSNPLDDPIPKN